METTDDGRRVGDLKVLHRGRLEIKSVGKELVSRASSIAAFPHSVR